MSELFPVKGGITRGDLGRRRDHGSFRRRKGKQADIPVVIPDRLGLRKIKRYRFSSADIPLAPNHLLHRLGGRYPRTARLAPPVAPLDRKFEIQTSRLLHRKMHEITPLGAHEPDRPLYVALVDRENLGSGKSDPLHRLKIGGNPLLGDIPAHPMPPSARFG